MARTEIASALTPSERDLMADLGDMFETAEAVPVSRRRIALLVDAPLFDRFLELLDRVETGDGREPDDIEGDTAHDEPSLGSGHFPMDQTQ
jgi:hypothetical protein